MGMNGDGDKTTRQSCNLNGDEPKGIRKGALFYALELHLISKNLFRDLSKLW